MKSGLRELFLLTFAAFRFPPTFRPSLSYRFFSSTIESRFLSLRSTKSLGTSLIRETKAARLKFVYCSPGCFYRVRRYSFYYNDKTGEVHSRFPPAVSFTRVSFPRVTSFFFKLQLIRIDAIKLYHRLSKTFQYLFANSIKCNLVFLKAIRFIMRLYKLLHSDFVKQSETFQV